MDSGVPWLFPYFRRWRGLNLSAGICAGDDHTHLKENNTLPAARAGLSLPPITSLEAEGKRKPLHFSHVWAAGDVEPKHPLRNLMTSSVPPPTVEGSPLPGGEKKRRSEPIR